ncbi:MAG: helix-turn-helix domain-containing protein [Polyangiaceae bacterium]
MVGHAQTAGPSLALRIALGLTQRELAERLEVHESQVSRDGRNEYHGMTVDRASWILDALGVKLRSIFPSSRVATPSIRVVTPSIRVVTPSIRVVTPSSRVVTPSSRVVTPSSRVVTPSSRVVTPSS